ncbi:ADP-ribosylglycohydrolase family protein [Rothia sp. RSM407]|uniref:ADP-ribosylglycohydrolase family protein n=1 Tax=Rothia sp. RSM407 TaxID=3398581 RepID=UPI00244BE782
MRGLLYASALGDALGYPLELLSAEQVAEHDPKPWDSAFGELLVSDDTQLTCFTLDALTEVLEWNNEGAAADELACLWLAYLRWFRGIGGALPESAPFSLDREIDGSSELTAHRGPGAATLRALGSGEMQLVSKSLNPDALGSGALVRSAALGVLPVAQERTVVLLAVRAAALTHGHPEALASAAAYALLVRDLLASPSGTFGALLEAARRVVSWCGSVAADDSIPGDASRTAAALSRAIELLEGGTVPVPEAVAEYFGTGWTAPELLGVAFWCSADAAKSLPADADDATVRGALFDGLCRAVSVDSDSDSVGAMTAALWAAAGFPVGGDEADAWSEALGRVRGLDQVEAVAERYLHQLGL